MHSLAVWFLGRNIGSLGSNSGELVFKYADDWLCSPDAHPISHSLPLRIDAYTGRCVSPFFGGLLPEGRLRDLIARQEGVSEKNDFSLLNIIGGDCGGAVSLFPMDETPDRSDGTVRYLNDSELSQVLTDLPQRPMLAGQNGLRLSLAGAQDKLPVVFTGEGIGLPLNGAPSTHILKMPISGLEDTVSNEAFCLALADKVGIPAASAEVLTNGDTKVLLVKRYDRQTLPNGGETVRIHQEDFCQALGVVSEAKYQREGGPSISDCFGLLRNTTKPFAPEILRFLDYIIFNTLVGNHDAHGKNFSLLYANKPQLAPLYDVVCTAIYPVLTTKMAMKVGSQYEFEHVMPRHWESLATSSSLNSKMVCKRVLAWANRLPTAAQTLQSESFESSSVVKLIVEKINSRCEKTTRLLTSN